MTCAPRIGIALSIRMTRGQARHKNHLQKTGNTTSLDISALERLVLSNVVPKSKPVFGNAPRQPCVSRRASEKKFCSGPQAMLLVRRCSTVQRPDNQSHILDVEKS